jgi:DNA-binding CsgD family transcriptional regulator
VIDWYSTMEPGGVEGLAATRRAEFTHIRRALGRADSGCCSIVLVEGDAGIGKTHLITTTADLASDEGALVLRTGLTEAETMLSWAGLSVLLSGIDEQILDRVPPPRRWALDRARGIIADGEIQAHDVAAALAALLTVCSADRLTVLVIDDVQWLDRATAAALVFSIRANLGARLSVLAARRRDAEVPVDLTRIPGAALERIEMTGLSAAGLHHLLADHGMPTVRRTDLIHIHELSGGNPLHAIDLARHLQKRGSLDGHQLTASARDAVVVRLDGLSADAIETGRVAALMALPTTRRIGSVIGPRCVDALAELEQRAVLTSSGVAVDFVHPLLREALLAGVGALERRALHLRIAEASDDPEHSALHRAEVADEPDDELAAALEAAADAAAELGASDVATARYRRAAELTPGDDHRALWRRRHRAVRGAIAVGHHAEVIREAQQLVRDAVTPEEIMGSVLDLTTAAWRTGGVSAARNVLSDGIDRLRACPRERLGLYEQLVRVDQLTDLALGAATARRALEEARATGDADLVGGAEIVSACAQVLTGEPVDVDALAPPGIDGREIALDAEAYFIELLVWTNRLDRAEPRLIETIERARRRGALLPVVRAASQLGDLYLRWGRWAEAEQFLVEVADLGDLIDYSLGIRADLAWVLAAQGHDAEASAQISLAAHLLQPPPDVERVQYFARAGFVDLCADRAPAARAQLRRAQEEAASTGFADAVVLPIGNDLVEALLREGDVDAAGVEADRFAAAADHAGAALGIALGLRCRAQVASARGDHAAALALFDSAIDAHDRLPVALPFERGRTLLAAGSARRRAGQRAASRPVLAEARAVFEGLGAKPFVARADAEIARLGGRAAPGGLSPTEQRVAALAASGRTNAEIAAELFITVRTVESNLTRVYRKLGVRSRTELVRTLESAD